MSVDLHYTMRRGVAPSRSGSKFWAQAIITFPDGGYANLKGGRCIEVRAWGKEGARGQWQVFGGLNNVHKEETAKAIFREKEDKGYDFDTTGFGSALSVEDAVARVRAMLGDAAGDGAKEALTLLAETEARKDAERTASAEASRNAVDAALLALPDNLSLLVV